MQSAIKKCWMRKKWGEKFPIAIADGNGRSMLLNIVVWWASFKRPLPTTLRSPHSHTTLTTDLNYRNHRFRRNLWLENSPRGQTFSINPEGRSPEALKNSSKIVSMGSRYDYTIRRSPWVNSHFAFDYRDVRMGGVHAECVSGVHFGVRIPKRSCSLWASGGTYKSINKFKKCNVGALNTHKYQYWPSM